MRRRAVTCCRYTVHCIRHCMMLHIMHCIVHCIMHHIVHGMVHCLVRCIVHCILHGVRCPCVLVTEQELNFAVANGLFGLPWLRTYQARLPPHATVCCVFRIIITPFCNMHTYTAHATEAAPLVRQACRHV